MEVEPQRIAPPVYVTGAVCVVDTVIVINEKYNERKTPQSGELLLIGFTDVISGVIKYDECCNQSDHANYGCNDGGFSWIKHVHGYKLHRERNPPKGEWY